MTKVLGLPKSPKMHTMKNKNQVELHKLIFTLNWEDPNSDIKALKIKPGDSMMTISSGGCNTLEFLLYDPIEIYAVDINPAQSYLLELKITAFQHLTYNEFRILMGLDQSNRITIYDKLSEHLSSPARSFWDAQSEIIEKGIIMMGRFEKFVKLAGKVIRILQGRRVVQDLFKIENLGDQQVYFDTIFNTWRFRAIFTLLFNRRMLARKGLSADYFHFDDGSKSFAESFYNRARNAIRNIPVKENYFLSLYLMGRYRNSNEIPAYLKPENFEIIKQRVDRIKIITKDANDWLQAKEDNSINCFSLSNICELKSEADTQTLFKQVARVGRSGGRCSFRNLMVPREVPDELQNTIIKDRYLSKELVATDRSFVYGKVSAYSIDKNN